MTLRDTLMTLYTDTPFQGAGADALFTLLLDYLDREHAFTGSPGDTSPQLAQATSLCQTTAGSINEQLQTLYSEAEQFAYQVDLARGVNPLLRPAQRLIDPHFPSDAVINASCDLPPSAPMRVETMDMDEVRWGRQMDDLGGQPLPQLPQEPTNPKFILPPVASIADDLSKQYGVPLSVVEDIINANPGLTPEEYALLVQYYKLYHTYPYNVRAVFKGLDSKGRERIFFLTQGDIDHIKKQGRHSHFEKMTDAQVIEFVKQRMKNHPDDFTVYKRKGYIDYYYDDVEIGNKYETIIVRVSIITPWRIISVFVESVNN
ncbi:MAG: hypothetical protein M3Z08_12030 [Chloroflexota bacterium]|nr:hypothetical protein [Chloroflexota bacterium]